MSTPGYRVSLKRTGSPTATTGETFNATTVANEYQIDTASKEILDRSVTPSGFKTSTGGSISSTELSDVNYLFGKLTFNTSHSSAITADVTHLPSQTIAGANSFTLNHVGDVLDDTDFDSTGYRSRTLGLRDVNLSVTRWDSLEMKYFNELVKSSESNEVVVEIDPDSESTGPIARGFFKVESENRSGDVGSLEQAELSFQVDGDDKAAYRWSDF